MTREENIRAILEAHFTGFRDDLIDSAVKRIEALSEPTKTRGIPMPINCEECEERHIRSIFDCQLIFSGCANCGRHPKCPLNDFVLKDNEDSEPTTTDTLAEIRAEIIDKYMTADGRMGSVSADIVKIIDKHIAESEESNNEM